MKKLRSSDGLSRELEHVFATFVAEASCPSFDALCSFLQRHPRHARELIEFAAEWALLTNLKLQGKADDWAIVERKADETIAHFTNYFHNPLTKSSSGTFPGIFCIRLNLVLSGPQ
jgi:hypothetical protein